MVMSSQRPQQPTRCTFFQRRLGLCPGAIELGLRQSELELGAPPDRALELRFVEFEAVGRGLRLAEQSAVAQQRFHGLARGQGLTASEPLQLNHKSKAHQATTGQLHQLSCRCSRSPVASRSSTTSTRGEFSKASA